MTEGIVQNLARLYAIKNRPDVVKLLATSTAEMIHLRHDNWNGGIEFYSLRLGAPAHLYAAVEMQSDDLERELLERAKPFLRGFEHEVLEEIIISLNLETDNKWRENALTWLETRTNNTKPASGSAPAYDFFISHATEDKESIVRKLAKGLAAKHAKVWYDEFELRIGDSLRRSIDRGLAKSRFGIVVLSKPFFAKNWPQYELDGLNARQIVGTKVILPIWHNITRDEIIQFSPPMADMLAFQTSSISIDEMVDEFMSLLEIRSPL